ncbi:cytochrome c1, partial [Acidiferrobacter sp.]
PNILAPWGGIYTKNGKLLVPGRESPAAYHRQVAEVVAFLRYASDPSVFERRTLGRYVIGVFVILSILAYLLKKDYWRDVHGKHDDEGAASGADAGKGKSPKPVTKA